jgi:3-hydroxyacyl-[acyl-carrier-protein] dehydratase
MLKDSLYTIHKINITNNIVETLIDLNEQHDILKGHFPSHAVLPGACILQMIKEILRTTLDTKLQLIRADEIKFLHMIEPAGNTVLLCSFQYDLKETALIYVTAKVEKDNVVCCKLKALYKKV